MGIGTAEEEKRKSNRLLFNHRGKQKKEGFLFRCKDKGEKEALSTSKRRKGRIPQETSQKFSLRNEEGGGRGKLSGLRKKRTFAEGEKTSQPPKKKSEGFPPHLARRREWGKSSFFPGEGGKKAHGSKKEKKNKRTRRSRKGGA